MALNIKPYYPLPHPSTEVGMVKLAELSKPSGLKKSENDVDLNASQENLSQKERSRIQELLKEYYKKLLNVLD
jgi:hypothetical protein